MRYSLVMVVNASDDTQTPHLAAKLLLQVLEVTPAFSSKKNLQLFAFE